MQITPNQIVELASTMINSCNGGTFCSLKHAAALADIADHLPIETAQALNQFLTTSALAVS